MKHSIERQIRIIILILSALAVGIYSLASYFPERDAYIESYMFCGEAAAWGAIRSVNWETVIAHTASEDEVNHAENTLQDMCKAESFLYSYVVVPQPEDSAIHYIVACNGEAALHTQSDSGEMIERYSTIHMPMIPELLDVWNGNASTSYLLLNNSNGHVLTFMCPIYGGDETILGVFCIDIAASELYNTVIDSLVRIVIALTMNMLLLSLAIHFVLRRKVFRPLNQIGARMNSFLASSQEQFQALPPARSKEFAAISDSFNTMVNNAQTYVADIESLTAEKTRRQAELNVASELQLGLLPPPSFESGVLHLDAALKPAVTLSGDFYDYFQLDEHRFAMLIADVSGKGITASIFMSRAVTLLRAYAAKSHSPAELLSATNNALSRNNPKVFFVTAFLCVFNTQDGTLTYANAGHNAPYLLNDTLITLEGEIASPLGLFPDEVYQDCTIRMNEGDSLFLYTDGVNEAVNSEHQFYGTHRLEQLLLTRPEKPIDAVLADIHSFVQDAPQSDDITMLSFRIGGR